MVGVGVCVCPTDNIFNILYNGTEQSRTDQNRTLIYIKLCASSSITIGNVLVLRLIVCYNDDVVERLSDE